MKEVLLEARKKLDKLNEADAKRKEREEKRRLARIEMENKSVIRSANVAVERLFNSIPKLIQRTIEKRESDVTLYSFNVDRGDNLDLYRSTIISKLKELLIGEGIKYEYKVIPNDDSSHYGSDSFGMPSYWTEYYLIIKI